VLFEPDWRGHPAGWLQHVLDHLDVLQASGRVLIVVSAQLIELIGDQLGRLDPARAEVVCLRAHESWACAMPILWTRALCRWWLIRRYVRLVGARNVIVFEFDPLTLPLGLQLGLRRASIVGILFRPSVHYPRTGDEYADWRDRLRTLRKDVLYALTLRNPAVRAVFSLDPYFAELAASRYGSGHKVKALPDPIDSEQRFVGTDDTPWRRTVPHGRTVFALCGSLTRRKGILALLDALTRIEREHAERIAVLIAGAVEPRIRDEVSDALTDLRRRRPEIWIDVEDGYIPDGDFWRIFAQTDVVLAPYQRFVGSSGILLWAARANKPVLTSDYGLLGRFVREYRLGLAVDTTDPSALAAAMIEMVQRGPQSFGDPGGRATFLQGRSPARFARLILAATLGDGVRED
jgi:glycosyltransferase involved in cell wall biosynthesis